MLSSPLLRALETAHVIAEKCAIPEVVVWLELREGFSGHYRGLSRRAFAQRFPRCIAPESMTETGWDHGNDTYETFWERASTTARRLQGVFHAEDRVAIITHGGMGNYLVHALLGIDRTRPAWFELDNGSLTHVRLVPDPQAERPAWPLYPPVEVEVLTLNDTAHLQETTRYG